MAAIAQDKQKTFLDWGYAKWHNNTALAERTGITHANQSGHYLNGTDNGTVNAYDSSPARKYIAKVLSDDVINNVFPENDPMYTKLADMRQLMLSTDTTYYNEFLGQGSDKLGAGELTVLSYVLSDLTEMRDDGRITMDEYKSYMTTVMSDEFLDELRMGNDASYNPDAYVAQVGMNNVTPDQLPADFASTGSSAGMVTPDGIMMSTLNEISILHGDYSNYASEARKADPEIAKANKASYQVTDTTPLSKATDYIKDRDDLYSKELTRDTVNGWFDKGITYVSESDDKKAKVDIMKAIDKEDPTWSYTSKVYSAVVEDIDNLPDELKNVYILALTQNPELLTGMATNEAASMEFLQSLKYASENTDLVMTNVYEAQQQAQQQAQQTTQEQPQTVEQPVQEQSQTSASTEQTQTQPEQTTQQSGSNISTAMAIDMLYQMPPQQAVDLICNEAIEINKRTGAEKDSYIAAIKDKYPGPWAEGMVTISGKGSEAAINECKTETGFFANFPNGFAYMQENYQGGVNPVKSFADMEQTYNAMVSGASAEVFQYKNDGDLLNAIKGALENTPFAKIVDAGVVDVMYYGLARACLGEEYQSDFEKAVSTSVFAGEERVDETGQKIADKEAKTAKQNTPQNTADEPQVG